MNTPLAVAENQPVQQQNRMTSWLALYSARLREFMTDSLCLDPDVASSRFGTFALELFACQFEHNDVYRRLCQARAACPDTVRDWRQIPAVPVSVFKEMDMTSLRLEERTRHFCSSGTTEGRRSRHFHSAESLALYETSLLKWFQTSFLVEPGGKPHCIFLTPPPGEALTSSLVHMFDTIARRISANGSVFAGRVEADGNWSLDIESLLVSLLESAKANQPVTLLGTAFNFVHLIDALAERGARVVLPAGSRAMETGGYKGRSRSLSKTALHDAISRSLGIARGNIVSEYGMCELSSQAYDRTPGASPTGPRRPGRFRFPPWAQCQVISPETGRALGEGEPGLLRIFDLANAASVVAVQTEDLAVQEQHGFELIGRATQTEPRGCSLMSV